MKPMHSPEEQISHYTIAYHGGMIECYEGEELIFTQTESQAGTPIHQVLDKLAKIYTMKFYLEHKNLI